MTALQDVTTVLLPVYCGYANILLLTKVSASFICWYSMEYLTNKQQFTTLGPQKSFTSPVICEVPQGSVLRPLLLFNSTFYPLVRLSVAMALTLTVIHAILKYISVNIPTQIPLLLH